MERNFLMVEVDPETKEKLRERAFLLRKRGGMSELVRDLITKFLGEEAREVPPTPQAEK